MTGAVVVGTGFGCRVHVPALRNAGYDVVALVGRDAERTARRAERLGVAHACTSLAEALAVPGVEAVSIATPPSTHAALAIEACEAGRHVICEKPFSLDAHDAAAMLAAAERAGVTHLVGHEFRWAPDRAVVARAIHDGLIGDAANLHPRGVRPVGRRSGRTCAALVVRSCPGRRMARSVGLAHRRPDTNMVRRCCGGLRSVAPRECAH